MRGQKTFNAEGQRAPEPVFAQGEMCDAKLDLFERREESACVALAVSVGIRAFGAVRAVMNEISGLKVTPVLEKVPIVEIPNRWLLIAT